MRTVHLCRCGLILILFLAVWNVGQAQDSLGMSCLSGLEYWSGADKIQMVGNLVYVVGSSAMHIVSLADPTNPVTIGRFTWYQYTGTTGGVYVFGNRAYLGLYYGAFILDISDPTHPLTLGQWQGRYMSDISFVHGNYAIAQTDERMPFVLDISDPTNVQHIGDFDIIGPQEGVGLAGEYLCMVGYPGGLHLYDMSDPAEPLCVASIDTTMMAHHAAISGNYAYVATLYDGLRIIDLSNPLQPMEVAACDTIGRTYDVTVTGCHAVTTKYSESDAYLNIWNIANPANPVFEGMIPTQLIGSARVASSGNLVCTTNADPYYSVMVVDISNPAAPLEVSSFGLGGGVNRMEIVGSLAYGAGFGVRTVDISDPYHLCELTQMRVVNVSGLDVATRGSYAYLIAHQSGMGTDGVEVFEVSNPAEPESLSYVLQENGQQIEIAGDYAYVVDLHYLYTYSLANPVTPQCVDMLNIPDPPEYLGLTTSDGYLYYGCLSGFYVYSLSNPAAPQLVGSCNLGSGGWVFDLDVAGHYAYVADGYGGLRIVDVSNPTNPTEVHWIGGYWVGSVTAAEDIVIMDDLTRISIYNVTDPINPILVGYYSTSEYMTDMEIQGQYLFTTSIYEFRAYKCDALTNVITSINSIPTEFSLLPPYPNPFNSTLTIPFTLPIQSEATISIYNILGQQVRRFAFPPLSPGAHRVLWNASSCASGVYIIRLISSNKELNQKALLLK
jgi:hypothetical protein